MNKFCLVLSGQIRLFEYGEESIADKYKNFIKSNNVDVYACIDTNNFYSRDDDCQYFLESKGGLSDCLIEDTRKYRNIKLLSNEEAINKIKKILEKYFDSNLKKIKFIDNDTIEHDVNNKYIKKFLDYNDDFIIGNRHILILNQYYCLKEAYELVEDKNKYDFFIRSRFDTFFYLPNELNTNLIYTSNSLYNIHDFWFCSDRNKMEKIFYYYDTISKNLIDKNLYLFYFDSENNILSTSKFINKNIGEYIDNKKIYKIENLSRSPEFGLELILKNNNYNLYFCNYICIKFFF